MHKINVPEKIIQNCISRRGKRYIFDKINLKSTALLVIDMQNCFIVPNLSIVEVPGLEGIVPNINSLARTLREAGGKVIWTEHIYTKEWSSWHDNFTNDQTRKKIINDTSKDSFARQLWSGMDK